MTAACGDDVVKLRIGGLTLFLAPVAAGLEAMVSKRQVRQVCCAWSGAHAESRSASTCSPEGSARDSKRASASGTSASNTAWTSSTMPRAHLILPFLEASAITLRSPPRTLCYQSGQRQVPQLASRAHHDILADHDLAE